MDPSVKSLKGTWPQALLTFLFPLFLVLSFRWALYEPFVIPSGSMIPHLLVHDHILVDKSKYGLKWPFSDRWMFFWRQPQRGDIVVFKYPLNPDVYYIKRLIGLPGDQVTVIDGQIKVNGQEWTLKSQKQLDLPGDVSQTDDFEYYLEDIKPKAADRNSSLEKSASAVSGNKNHWVRFYKAKGSSHEETTYDVPQGKYFFMGDNRDQSSDGRVWGFVSESLIVGQARWIWLSCDKTLVSAPFVCDPGTLRWSRMFRGVF